MPNRASVLLAATLFIASTGFAKDKKPPLPFTVLQARTVVVLVDRDAGMSVEDPRANQVAQKDVETAFLNWGRFLPLLSGQPADLIIVVRKGLVVPNAVKFIENADAALHDPYRNWLHLSLAFEQLNVFTGSIVKGIFLLIAAPVQLD